MMETWKVIIIYMLILLLVLLSFIIINPFNNCYPDSITLAGGIE